MTNLLPQPIHLPQANAWQGILPRSPLLSSTSTGWQGIYVEHHHQPAHDTPDYCLPSHLLSIGLGYRAKEFRANGRLYKNFVVGNVGICPAHESLRTQAYGEAEFLLIAIDQPFFNKAVCEAVDGKAVELMPQILGQDPLIYQIGLALKQQLEFNRQDSRLYADSIATALAVHLMQRYSMRHFEMPSCSGGLPKMILRLVVAYIQAHLNQDLCVSELAAIAQMSPHHFSSLFKQSTGLAPHQYIVQTRIEAAKQLLGDRELTIVEVCHRVGFQSQSHFTHVFRKYTHVTPKTYRNLI